MKFIVFIAIILGGWYFFRLLKKSNPSRSITRPAKTIHMVPCAYCGTHIPENEAICRHGKTWCNEKHAQLGIHP